MTSSKSIVLTLSKLVLVFSLFTLFWSTGYYNYYYVNSHSIKSHFDSIQYGTYEDLKFLDNHSLYLTADTFCALDLISKQVLFQIIIRLHIPERAGNIAINSTNYTVNHTSTTKLDMNTGPISYTITKLDNYTDTVNLYPTPVLHILVQEDLPSQAYYRVQTAFTFQLVLTNRNSGATLTLPQFSQFFEIIGVSSLTVRFMGISSILIITLSTVIILWNKYTLISN